MYFPCFILWMTNFDFHYPIHILICCCCFYCCHSMKFVHLCVLLEIFTYYLLHLLWNLFLNVQLVIICCVCFIQLECGKCDSIDGVVHCTLCIRSIKAASNLMSLSRNQWFVHNGNGCCQFTSCFSRLTDVSVFDS